MTINTVFENIHILQIYKIVNMCITVKIFQLILLLLSLKIKYWNNFSKFQDSPPPHDLHSNGECNV